MKFWLKMLMIKNCFFDILYETVPKIGMRFFNNLTKNIRIIINIRSSGKKMFFSNKTIIFYDFFLLFIDARKSQRSCYSVFKIRTQNVLQVAKILLCSKFVSNIAKSYKILIFSLLLKNL